MTAPASTRAPDPPKINGINIADACRMQISDLAQWIGAIDDESVAPLLSVALVIAEFVRRHRPGLPVAGSGRRERCPGWAQRSQLIRHLVSPTDVTYVFDRPIDPTCTRTTSPA